MNSCKRTNTWSTICLSYKSFLLRVVTLTQRRHSKAPKRALKNKCSVLVRFSTILCCSIAPNFSHHKLNSWIRLSRWRTSRTRRSRTKRTIMICSLETCLKSWLVWLSRRSRSAEMHSIGTTLPNFTRNSSCLKRSTIRQTSTFQHKCSTRECSRLITSEWKEVTSPHGETSASTVGRSLITISMLWSRKPRAQMTSSLVWELSVTVNLKLSQSVTKSLKS